MVVELSAAAEFDEIVEFDAMEEFGATDEFGDGSAVVDVPHALRSAAASDDVITNLWCRNFTVPFSAALYKCSRGSFDAIITGRTENS